ncbi:hypothetical protein CMI40_01910 [Candidatus Pacearchaeota archaeon]|jgi:rRNA-processing protein FCF1|nr:hypothetical protein [Candidatus Pacearchaeota archaeon]|tara:strand:- start:3432 stop:3803 length:372 start_codon:yes stop_codon:yes gene_type:complete
MKKVIIDTNFILSCIRNKIDFFEEIKLMGMEILIPKQVIDELKRIHNSKKKLHFRENAKVALKILEKNSFKKIDLKQKYVDKGLIQFTKKNQNIIIATLDRELKMKIKNPKLVIRNKKKLEII